MPKLFRPLIAGKQFMCRRLHMVLAGALSLAALASALETSGDSCIAPVAGPLVGTDTRGVFAIRDLSGARTLSLIAGGNGKFAAVVKHGAVERKQCRRRMTGAANGKFGSCSIPVETGKMTTQRCSEGCNGQTIDLVVGQTIEIHLPENPTTGFRWQRTTKDLAVCRLVSDTFGASSGPPGHGGEHSWIFAAVRPGECDIEFHLRRRWAGSAEPARTFKIYIRVEHPDRGAEPSR
jgi:inhibitor of cysteine peptidase